MRLFHAYKRTDDSWSKSPNREGQLVLLTMAEQPIRSDLDRVDLPISRYDIADYIGLSVENRFGRSLTVAQERGLMLSPAPFGENHRSGCA